MKYTLGEYYSKCYFFKENIEVVYGEVLDIDKFNFTLKPGNYYLIKGKTGPFRIFGRLPNKKAIERHTLGEVQEPVWIYFYIEDRHHYINHITSGHELIELEMMRNNKQVGQT